MSDTQDFNFSQLTAMVVEDNDFVRHVVVKYMESFGFSSVVSATDGQNGLDLIHELANIPDIVICDIDMEPMDGFDFLKSVRGLGGVLSQVPVIFLTSDASRDRVYQAQDLGVNAYVLKPVTIVALRKKVTGLLQQKLSV